MSILSMIFLSVIFGVAFGLSPQLIAARTKFSRTSFRKEDRQNPLESEVTLRIYNKYLLCWSNLENSQRVRILEELVSSDVNYSTPRHESGERSNIIEDMISFQAKFPLGRCYVENMFTHHNTALLSWSLVQSDGKVIARGFDQLRISEEGKIVEITTYAPTYKKDLIKSSAS